MKRLPIALTTVVLVALGIGTAFGQNWGNRQKWENPASWQKWDKEEKKNTLETGNPENTTKPEKKKRYCSVEQEQELLDLLQQLEDPAFSKKETLGGTSEVRRKYQIARKLRKFDDCRAEDALRKLSKEDLCEDLGEGDLICLKWAAEASLQEIDATADMKKLVPETPLDEQEKKPSSPQLQISENCCRPSRC